MSWLAQVFLRPTGTVSAGGIEAPVDSRRVSAASLLAVLAEQAGRSLDTPFYWDADSDGKMLLSRGSTFTLEHSGDLTTALGLSGTYTGASAYTGDVAMPGVTVPRGLRLSGPLWSSEAPGAANFSAASAAALTRGGSGTLLLDMAYADIWAFEFTARGKVFDVVHSGRWVGRCRVNAVERRRLGRRAGLAVLELSVEGCA